MRKMVLAGLLAITLFGATTPARAGNQDFTLINKTGLILEEIYISASNVNDWEEDVLDQDVLRNNQSYDIEFTGHQRECKYDIKVVDNRHKDHIFTGINLCKLTKLTLRRDGNRFTYHWVND